MPKNLDAYLVKTPPLHPVAVVTVVAAVAAADPEVEVEAAGPEVEAAAAAAGPEAAAAGPEAAEEEEMMMTMMTRMMTMMMPPVHPRAERVHPVEPDGGSSTIKKWSSNWLKSCKINARWRRDDALPASRPPIPSRPRIRMDAVPP